jgi:hypothetical protein
VVEEAPQQYSLGEEKKRAARANKNSYIQNVYASKLKYKDFVLF